MSYSLWLSLFIVLFKVPQTWTLPPMSFDMLGTFHFTSVNAAGSHLTRTCCWQPWTHFSPLPTSKGPWLQ